jgi:PPM family protein phosphatase
MRRSVGQTTRREHQASDMIQVTTFSEPGGHPVNEDAFIVQPYPSGSDRWLCVLADGQGGRAGGADAARIACCTAADAALRREPAELADPEVWHAILRHADRAVCEAPRAGFTTVLGFVIAGRSLAGASCGDSAVLTLSAGERAREISKGQLKNPPVGSGEARFTSFSASLAAPWTVLAMSDGVWKYVGRERLVGAMMTSRGDALVEVLQGLARLPRTGQFPDDFTLVAFEETG